MNDNQQKPHQKSMSLRDAGLEDTTRFEIADNVCYCYCEGGCENLHLVLRDQDNDPFAGATLTVEMIETMLEIAKQIRSERTQ